MTARYLVYCAILYQAWSLVIQQRLEKHPLRNRPKLACFREQEKSILHLLNGPIDK
jgi:hypothetical protein